MPPPDRTIDLIHHVAFCEASRPESPEGELPRRHVMAYLAEFVIVTFSEDTATPAR